MDLALEMGMPAQLLAHVMTEREFRAWDRYRAAHALPARRMELYLAQVAQVIAAAMGGAKNATLQDYLIKFEPAVAEEAPPEIDVPKLQAAFGYNPRKKRN